MSEDGIISSSSEAKAVGFKAVAKVTGTFTSLTRKESTFTNEDGKPSKDQIELVLEDAFILAMLEDKEGRQEPIPELKDDRFMDWLPYAKKGEEPTKQSSFVRGFVKSAEKLWEDRGKKGQGWRELINEVITLEKKPISYTFDKGTEKERKESYMVWHFVENDEESGGSDTVVADIVRGKKPQIAARDLMIDARTKNNAEVKALVRTGQPVAGLEVIDGIYQDTGSDVKEPVEAE